MTEKKNLVEGVLKELEWMIVEQMNPGDKLPSEMELAERFNVGRSTIRESMTALTAKKLVVKRKEGTFVSEHVNECLIDPLNIMIHMEVGEIKDLMQIREILELGTIRLAAEKADEETILNMERLDWQMNEPALRRRLCRNEILNFIQRLRKQAGILF